MGQHRGGPSSQIGDVCRDGRASPALLTGLEALQADLLRLSNSLDSVLFRETWKGAAIALNRLMYNKLITESKFSPQVVSISCPQ